SRHSSTLHPFPTRRSSDLVMFVHNFSRCAAAKFFPGKLKQIVIRMWAGGGDDFDFRMLRLERFVEQVVAIEIFLSPLFIADTERSEEHTSELQSRENIVCR